MAATAVGKPAVSVAQRQPTQIKSSARRLKDAWNSSLPRRVTISASVLTVIVAFIGGMLIMSQVRSGLLTAKRQASIVEASTALQRMQNQLNDTDLRSQSVFDRVGQLAVDFGLAPSQYGVVVDAGSSVYTSRGLAADSVSQALRQEVAGGGGGLWVTATKLNYQDGRVEPGLVIGGNLFAPNGVTFPVYFLFSQAAEQATLDLIRNALLTSGLLLMAALAAVTWLVSRQITEPVQRASAVATRIAQGELGLRLPVRGNDEFAVLARSMNRMARNSQQQIVQLERLSQMQQRFVSDVSHELRTPLTTMRMAGELIYDSRDEFAPMVGRSAELLHDEIERFDVLLADLLEISRFDAGAAELAVDEIDLADLVRQEITATQALALTNHTPVSFESEGESFVEADPRRIRRIVRNLLTNAIEHGEARPIEVHLSGDEQSVTLRVRDHGIGLEAGQEELVFHRFWRADASRNRQVGGGGLGLAISREDARLHGGLLDAYGVPGEGSVFRLTLPTSQSEPLVKAPPPLAFDDQEVAGD